MTQAEPRTNLVPIPPIEQTLDTTEAEPWFQVSTKSLQLEGLCFDRQGNLFFCDVFGGTIFHLDMQTQALTEIYQATDEFPAAVKIHRDGRLFVCCLGNFEIGHIFAIQPDGTGRETILEGYVADDMVFAPDGSFYFTHFVGKSTEPTGGLYHVSSDYQTITPILENLAGPNGIALSTNHRVLWATETNANRLHHIALEEDGVSIPHYGTCVPYRFTGFLGPDSCCIDSGDNLYVAMYEQGRVLIFNPRGYPLAQVLMPGRDEGHLLRTTHPMLRPDTNELYICTNDGDGDQGSWILKARGLTNAHPFFQFA